MKNYKRIIIAMLIIAVFCCVSLAATACRDTTKGDENDTRIETQDEKNESEGDTGDTENEGSSGSGEPLPVDFSTLVYTAFGDSITYGYASGGRMPNPYPQSVGGLLGLSAVNNQGVSGATLVANVSGRACIASLVQSFDGEGDIISIMGGVNDYGASTPLGSEGDTTTASIYGSLDFIAKTLTERYPNAFIFFMTPYKCVLSGRSCYSDNSQGYNLYDVACAVKYTAEKYSLPVLDTFADGMFEDVEIGTSGCDNLHPSQSFMTQYAAPQIEKFIRDNYKTE